MIRKNRKCRSYWMNYIAKSTIMGALKVLSIPIGIAGHRLKIKLKIKKIDRVMMYYFNNYI